MNQFGEHIRSVKDLYKPKRTDSDLVRKCKAEIAAIESKRDTYEHNGDTLKVQTRAEAFRGLGLHARWGQ